MTERLDPLRFPLRGSRLIEASAGTGKTYTLAALYVRLVLNHGGDNAFGSALLPPDILVVTFTEAATRELRDRIRERLAGSARCFRGQQEPDPKDEFLNQLLSEYPADQHPACADRLDAAAQWMDEAAVYTIHSFCHRMLRQHAFDSGSLFDLELSQEEDLLREQAVQDYWRTFFYPLDAEQTECLTESVRTPDDLLRKTKPLLGHYGERDASKEPAAILSAFIAEREKARREVRERWKQWARELLALFEKAWQDKRLPTNKPSQATKIREWLNNIIAWADDPAPKKNPLTDTAFKRLSREELDEHGNDIGELLEHPAIAQLEELKAPDADLPDLLPRILPHAAGWIGERLQRNKRQRALINYDDMLTRLRDALYAGNGKQLAGIIRQQFPVALIDEFQDTDPVQYDIFHRIYAEQDNTGWFMIGDPKQAIYAFRGADVFTYLKAKHFTDGRHYTLGTNFRSAEGLVDAVNHVFSAAEQRPGGAFLLEGEIPFHAVDANGRPERLEVEGEPQAPLTFWRLDADEHQKAPSFPKTQYVAQMAERAATEMTRLLNLAAQEKAGFRDEETFKPLRPADMAVLVRDRTEAAAIRNALAQRGLRSVYLSDKDSVMATAEAADLLRWLHACAEPENERLLRAALATATLDLPWQTLLELVENETAWEDRVEDFRGYRDLWRRRGVLPMVRQILRDFDVPARLLTTSDGERVLTNLLHLSELLQSASTQLDGEQALARWLAEEIQTANEGDTRDEQIMRLESDADLIKVVTIHKSKGLEYPLVFLPFICTFRKVDGTKLPVRYHNDKGEPQLSLEPDNATIRRADRERLAEDMRLLYVALTRPRHACWLGVAPMRVRGKVGESHLHESGIGHLLAGGEYIAPEILPERLQQLAGNRKTIRIEAAPRATPARFVPTETTPALEPAREYHGPHPEHWWIASYSALQKAEHEGPEAPATPREDILAEEETAPARLPAKGAALGPHDFIRGPMAGTFLHGLLEWAADPGFASCRADNADFLDLLHQRCSVRRWEEWEPILADWLARTVTTPLPLGPYGEVPLADLPDGKLQPEMEFWLPAHHVDVQRLDELVCAYSLNGAPRPALEADQLNGMLKGFIDLTFEHEGRFYVADYKSNWLGDNDNAYTAKALTEAVLEKRYDMQYCLYLLALHRLLKARLHDDYDYDRHIGGSVYLFLRGIGNDTRGVHFERPPAALMHELDALFTGETANA